MTKRTMLVILVAMIFLVLGLYFFLNRDHCATITDSSARAQCTIELAEKEQNIQSCHLNYYTLTCIQKADPQHTAKKEAVGKLCAAITDSSTRADCEQYVANHY